MRSAAIMVVALVLLATVVTGRESEPAAQPVRAIAVPTLDLSRLARERQSRPVEEIFAVPLPPSPPVATPKPEQVFPPTAPSLPFTYLGRMQKADRVTLYLLRNQEMVIAEVGATLEGVYRLERVSAAVAHFTYLPLGTEQTLAIPPAP